MAQKKTQQASSTKAPPTLFDRQNLLWMVIGAAVIALGMILMVGGKSDDPAVFNKDEVYSFTRIKLAPTLIILGLVIEIVAIFRKPK
jgi:hypothetical protein